MFTIMLVILGVSFVFLISIVIGILLDLHLGGNLIPCHYDKQDYFNLFIWPYHLVLYLKD